MHLEDLFGIFSDPLKRSRYHEWTKSVIFHQRGDSGDTAEPGSEYPVRVYTPDTELFEKIVIIYTLDGSFPVPEQSGYGEFTPCETVWDTLSWKYVTEWTFILPPREKNTLFRYMIYGITRDSGRIIYANTSAEDLNKAEHFGIWINNYPVPEWSRKAVIYQIFLDRFNPGRGRTWNRKARTMMDIYGGTINGVTEKLDYISSMGFNAIWLSPFFPSPSHHGYDATDYFSVEPRLGSMEDMERLIDEAGQIKIKLILDFVANHWSREHPHFLKAVSDQDNPAKDWYIWKKYPHEYESFFGVKELPKINLLNREARGYLFDSAVFWIKKGFSGLRLDYTPGPQQDFWADFYSHCREASRDVWIFGEAVEGAVQQRSFYGTMDGSLDFLTSAAVRGCFAHKNIPLRKLASFMQVHRSYFPEKWSSPVFIDNHDMDRFLYVCRNDPGALKRALVFIYTLDQPPIIYYGTEAGLGQNRGFRERGHSKMEDSRRPMDWTETDRYGLKLFCTILAKIRKDFLDFFTGKREIEYISSQTVVWKLSKGKNPPLFVGINNDKKSAASLSGVNLKGYKDILGMDSELVIKDDQVRTSAGCAYILAKGS